MKHLIPKLAILALAVSGFAAQAQESGLERQVNAASVVSQPLNSIVITGSGNPLLRSDQRIAALSASLPLDASASAGATSLERVVALFPQDPNAATGEARRMMERGHTPPSGSDPDGRFGVGTR